MTEPTPRLLWIRKALPPSLAHAQRFEANALAALKRAGASEQTSKALLARAFSTVARGDITDLDAALDAEIVAVGGVLADAWNLAAERANAIDQLDDLLPEEAPVTHAAQADPEQQLAAQSATLRKQDPALSHAQARARVLKAHPELYNAQHATSGAPALDAGEGTVADIVDAALAVALRKRLDAGEQVGIAARNVVNDAPALAQLAEICRLYPAEAAHGIVEGSARLRKRRPDVDVARLVKSVIAADPVAITLRVAKRRAS